MDALTQTALAELYKLKYIHLYDTSLHLNHMEECQMSCNRYQHMTLNGKKQAVHRHVIEQHLCRTLASNEHVYHLDGDPSNNGIDNLVVIVKKNCVASVKMPRNIKQR
jgi:hypothetical protein